MDDLLREFLTETSESLDTVDNQLVKFEQEPNNAKILDNIFRLVHTHQGTCGFLGLPRLEALAHCRRDLMDKFRCGMPVTAAAVTLILASIDRIKEILAGLEATEPEPGATTAISSTSWRRWSCRAWRRVSVGFADRGRLGAADAGGYSRCPVAEAPPLAPEAPAEAMIETEASSKEKEMTQVR